RCCARARAKCPSDARARRIGSLHDSVGAEVAVVIWTQSRDFSTGTGRLRWACAWSLVVATACSSGGGRADGESESLSSGTEVGTATGASTDGPTTASTSAGVTTSVDDTSNDGPKFDLEQPDLGRVDLCVASDLDQ